MTETKIIKFKELWLLIWVRQRKGNKQIEVNIVEISQDRDKLQKSKKDFDYITDKTQKELEKLLKDKEKYGI